MLFRRILFAVFLFQCGFARAELFRGAISSSLAGAGVAGIPATEGALLNPAAVPIYTESGIDAYYRDGYADQGQHRTSFGLGAIDNGPQIMMPGALHYLRTRDTGRASKAANGELWHAAFGQRIENFSLGVGFYRLQYEMLGLPRYTQWNFSVGGIYMFLPNFGVGWVFRNIANPGSNIPMGLREDLAQQLGVFYGIGDTLRMRADLARQEHFNPHHKMAYILGLESKTSPLLSFRLGYKYDDLAFKRLWTAGFGFDGPKLRAEYSIEKPQEGVSGALHSVDLRLAF